MAHLGITKGCVKTWQSLNQILLQRNLKLLHKQRRKAQPQNQRKKKHLPHQLLLLQWVNKPNPPALNNLILSHPKQATCTLKNLKPRHRQLLKETLGLNYRSRVKASNGRESKPSPNNSCKMLWRMHLGRKLIEILDGHCVLLFEKDRYLYCGVLLFCI